MQFVRGGHRSGRTARHTIGTTTPTWYTELSPTHLIADLFDNMSSIEDLPEDMLFTAEVPAGTAILFSGLVPHRSLNSVSSNIRWSTDYRLHRRTPRRQGKTPLDWFYGLKDSLLLRDPQDMSFQGADWASWSHVDRTEIQDNSLGEKATKDFDDVIIGPWMDLWNITTHRDGLKNRHVDRYLQSEAALRPGGSGYLPDNW